MHQENSCDRRRRRSGGGDGDDVEDDDRRCIGIETHLYLLYPSLSII
jgi:hypothetical protein